jgi:1-acyl-sn-glycerol-3-phosphate acyltransferase
VLVDGPVVLPSNHVSFLDFLLVGPAGRRSDRYVRFLARHEAWGTRSPGR